MNPDPHIHGALRYGAFLPTIHPERRIGDYVHATARIANVILCRLDKLQLPALSSVVRTIRTSLAMESSNLSHEDRIGMWPPTPNQIDLTQSKLFLNNPNHLIAIVECLRQTGARALCKGKETGLQLGNRVPY